ncbi:siderophore-interacting protein [Tianweitania sp.]|uniref:siderophore-interacting protein n=1 Tax=Tianweitania sp. TaxID=2021634 RepID=UPI00289F6A9C|nr:siderophore-interacting protein [Tianweitania sp.]
MADLRPSEPITQRIKHELRRRTLTVQAVERVTPRMVRITLGGAELDNFLSAAPDDHIKLFFPGAAGKPEMRDFTPRHYDGAAGTLAIDFVLHEGGPAGSFAANAQVGDTLEIGGPRGSLIVSRCVKRWLLIGDETALPAIGRRIEELGADAEVHAIIAVADAQEEQSFASRAEVHLTWVHRDPTDSANPEPVLAVLRESEFVSEMFVWVGAEASVARAVRDYILNERGHPKSWMRASGYWQMGHADAHGSLD